MRWQASAASRSCPLRACTSISARNSERPSSSMPRWMCISASSLRTSGSLGAMRVISRNAATAFSSCLFAL